MFKSIAYVMSVMIYYFIESLLVGLFVSVAYHKILFNKLFIVDITYFQWVVMIWIVKVLLFDLFKVNVNKDIVMVNETNTANLNNQ